MSALSLRFAIEKDQLIGFLFNSRRDLYVSAWNKLANGSGLDGWPFPSLEHSRNDYAGGAWSLPTSEFHGYGGAETNGEPSGTSTRGTSRKVIPIE